MSTYPSCRLRFKFRFEDYLRGAPPADGGASSFGGDFHPLERDVLPTTLTLTRNSYREADTLTATLAFDMIPIDPRIIRAATVRVYCGAVQPEVYAEGMGRFGARDLVVVPDVDPITGISNEVFRGFVDGWKVSYADDSAISLKARDLTQYLIDAKLPPSSLANIGSAVPLDDVIRLLLLGEPASALTPAAEWNRNPSGGAVAAPRGAEARLLAAIAATQAKLQRALVARPAAPDLVSRLNTQLLSLELRLAEVQAVLGTYNEIPISMSRFGLPGARGFVVVNETGDNPMPSLSDVRGAGWQDSAGNVAKSKGKGGGKDEITYWDLITDLVVSVGYICYVRVPTRAIEGVFASAEIVITTPRVYYETTQIQPDGSVLAIEPQEIREFVYGRNVDALELERDLAGKTAPTTIEVKAILQETGQHISLRYPTEPITNRASAEADGAGDREEIATFLYGPIPEQNAGKTMLRISQSIYEQLGRKEFTVGVETDALAGFPSNYDNPSAVDMFGLVAGDSVRVGLEAPDPEYGTNYSITSAGVIASLGIADRVDALTQLGFSLEGAMAAAEASGAAGLQEVFRVKTFTIDWGADGFAFKMELINYLDVRAAIVDAAPTTYDVGGGEELVL